MPKTRDIDFWVIGAQKAGTSWLYEQLHLLPSFSMLPIKELHYFDRDPKYPSPNKLSETQLSKRLKNSKWRKPALQKVLSKLKAGKLDEAQFYWKWHFSNYDDAWYHSLFLKGDGLKGEITPSYSILEVEDIKKMYSLAPDAKIILILRNPIERAWSHYRYSTRKNNHFSETDIDTHQIIEFLNSKAQMNRSDYIKTINNYLEVFPKEQVLLGFYDAIVDKPEQLLTEITSFIGDVPPNEINENTQLQKVFNRSRSIDCPAEIKEHLKSIYYPQIKELAASYGGYCAQWLEKTYNEMLDRDRNPLNPTTLAKT